MKRGDCLFDESIDHKIPRYAHFQSLCRPNSRPHFSSLFAMFIAERKNELSKWFSLQCKIKNHENSERTRRNWRRSDMKCEQERWRRRRNERTERWKEIKPPMRFQAAEQVLIICIKVQQTKWAHRSVIVWKERKIKIASDDLSPMKTKFGHFSNYFEFDEFRDVLSFGRRWESPQIEIHIASRLEHI